MTRSGRIRRALLIRSLMVISPLPFTVAFLVSSLTRFLIPIIRSSALSSMVIILSSGGINPDRTFRSVVLPEPVDPLTSMLYFAHTRLLKKSRASLVILFVRTSISESTGRFGNLLIVSIGPFMATGSRTALTLDPSASLASSIGDDRLIVLFTPEAILPIMSRSLSLDSNRMPHPAILPSRSANISSIPFTIISVTESSSRRSCRTSSLRILLNSSWLICPRCLEVRAEESMSAIMHSLTVFNTCSSSGTEYFSSLSHTFA